jgi:hypothetical protein
MLVPRFRERTAIGIFQVFISEDGFEMADNRCLSDAILAVVNETGFL